MTTPMQRTLSVLKKDNLKYWRVEVWNSFMKRRIDLLNIIDLLVFNTGSILGIQICGSDLASHKKKIMETEQGNTITWLKTKAFLQVWAWRKLKKVKGKKATYWKPRIIDVTLAGNELFWEERE